MQPYLTFYARQHMLSVYMLRQFRPYVRLSVTCVDCIKMAEYIIKILLLSDRIILLVFRQQGSLRKSDGFTAKAPNTSGRVAIFNQCGYILETVIDTGIFMEDEYKFVCSLSNSAAFDDLEWPLTSVCFKVTVTGEYLENGASDLLHVWY